MGLRFAPIPYAAMDAVDEPRALLDLYRRGHNCRWGWFVLRERDAEAAWRVSRRRVREVLSVLSAAGLLEIQRGASARGDGAASTRIRVYDPQRIDADQRAYQDADQDPDQEVAAPVADPRRSADQDAYQEPDQDADHARAESSDPTRPRPRPEHNRTSPIRSGDPSRDPGLSCPVGHSFEKTGADVERPPLPPSAVAPEVPSAASLCPGESDAPEAAATETPCRHSSSGPSDAVSCVSPRPTSASPALPAATSASTTAPDASRSPEPMRNCVVLRHPRRPNVPHPASFDFDVPTWTASAADEDGVDPVDLLAAVGRSLEAILQRPTDARSRPDGGEAFVELWRAKGRPPLAELADEVRLVAEWAHLSEEMEARQWIRGLGWGDDQPHPDVSFSPRSIMKVAQFGNRLRLAQEWHARDRTSARSGRGEYDERQSDAIGWNDPRGTALMQESYDKHGARGMPLRLLQRKGVRLTAADEAALAAEPAPDRERRRPAAAGDHR